MNSDIEEFVLLNEGIEEQLVFDDELKGVEEQLVSAGGLNKRIEEQLVSTDTDAEDNQNLPIIVAETQKSENGKDKISAAEDDQLPNLAEVDVTGCFKGLRARTLQELEDLYREHADKLGFTYKRATQRRNHQQVITEKYLKCSCEGKPRVCPNPKKRKKSGSKVTGCMAIMRIKLVNNLYTVVHHHLQHNHELSRSAWRSNRRKVTVENGKSNARDNEETAANFINANGNGEIAVDNGKSNARDNEETAANFINANGNGEIAVDNGKSIGTGKCNAPDDEATTANFINANGNGRSIGTGIGNMIVVKATFGDDTAKFPWCSNSGIEELRKELDDIFGFGSDKVKLKYKDDDGSWITLFRDKDLHFHIKTLKTSGQSAILELSVLPVTL